MKELSIEEKAKAYDETIEKLRNFYRDYDTVSRLIDVKEELSNLIPELKESEDEKIRNWLISTLKSLNSTAVHIDGAYEMMLPAIDWLEKQGKNNMGISEATKKKLEDNLNRALKKETPESCNEFLEKQGEQKPAWSEEDEKMMQYVIGSIDTNISDSNFKNIRSWFETIKERVQAQPKQEWSEEDEEEFQIAIETLAEAGQHDSANWLKSLKERYAWKPSDEQLDALYLAAMRGDEPKYKFLV